jgi:hypothetical protein
MADATNLYAVTLVDKRDPMRTTLHKVTDLRRYFVANHKVNLLRPNDPEGKQDFIERLEVWLTAGTVPYFEYIAPYYYVIVLDMNAQT